MEAAQNEFWDNFLERRFRAGKQREELLDLKEEEEKGDEKMVVIRGKKHGKGGYKRVPLSDEAKEILEKVEEKEQEEDQKKGQKVFEKPVEEVIGDWTSFTYLSFLRSNNPFFTLTISMYL